MVWTAAASGLRFGELAGLTIEHVNLERRELRVMQALDDIKGQGPTLGPPKTESAVRTVPVAESIALPLSETLDEPGDAGGIARPHPAEPHARTSG